MDSKLIIALDFDDENKTLTFIDTLDPKYCALKIGSSMFTRFGHKFLKKIIQQQFKVFLDLKFHDIPQQVADACKAAADLGVWMTNVHALGGLKMMETAQQALLPYGNDKPLLIAVTILTSMSELDYAHLGMQNSLGQTVIRLAKLAHKANLDGVVCSAFEVKSIKEACSTKFLTVTPGIRLENDNSHDQARVLKPSEAIKAGSDYLVVGRSITESNNPLEVIKLILKDCDFDNA